MWNKSDEKWREPYYFTHVGKKTESNKRNEFIDTDNGMVITRERGRKRVGEVSKGSQIYTDGRTLDIGWWARKGVYRWRIT